MFADMVEAIDEGRESGPAFDDAYQAQRAVEAMAKSLETRSWVRIADVV
jgi:predicted dehydrogenase